MDTLEILKNRLEQEGHETQLLEEAASPGVRALYWKSLPNQPRAIFQASLLHELAGTTTSTAQFGIVRIVSVLPMMATAFAETHRFLAAINRLLQCGNFLLSEEERAVQFHYHWIYDPAALEEPFLFEMALLCQYAVARYGESIEAVATARTTADAHLSELQSALGLFPPPVLPFPGVEVSPDSSG